MAKVNVPNVHIHFPTPKCLEIGKWTLGSLDLHLGN